MRRTPIPRTTPEDPWWGFVLASNTTYYVLPDIDRARTLCLPLLDVPSSSPHLSIDLSHPRTRTLASRIFHAAYDERHPAHFRPRDAYCHQDGVDHRVMPRIVRDVHRFSRVELTHKELALVPDRETIVEALAEARLLGRSGDIDDGDDYTAIAPAYEISSLAHEFRHRDDYEEILAHLATAFICGQPGPHTYEPNEDGKHVRVPLDRKKRPLLSAFLDDMCQAEWSRESAMSMLTFPWN